MRIAIIGSGISGLVAAYLLSRKHDITVFESNQYVGGHTHTVQVRAQGETHFIDTGFIVFNPENYPNFNRLLDRLGVESQPTCMSFSVRCDQSGLEYNASSLNQLFAQRRNLLRFPFYRMIGDILRFNGEAPSVLTQDSDSLSVDDFVRRGSYSREFVDHYLLPLGASLWSCPSGAFRRFPIRFVVEFLHNHAMLQIWRRPVWRVIKGGAFRYVEKLTRHFHNRIRLACPVQEVRRGARKVKIVYGRGLSEDFDQVIMACHSDQALKLLGDSSETERDLLSAFPYQPNLAVLHSDRSVLPQRSNAWASWNYHRALDQQDQVAVTYNMNLLQGLETSQVFNLTLNRQQGIDQHQTFGRYHYHHPVFTPDRADAQCRHSEMILSNRTSFCGAYWGYGFHEDGVNSALAVCAAFGEAL